MTTQIVGIVLEDYKLDTFKKVFARHNVRYELGAGPTSDSVTLRVTTEDTYELQKVVREAQETFHKEWAAKVPIDVPSNMTYELWSDITDKLLGTLELGNPPIHAIDSRVTVKVKGKLTDASGKSFNAIQVNMCIMDNRDAHRRVIRRYWALETNLNPRLAPALEGFTPKIEIPSLSQMFAINRTRLH